MPSTIADRLTLIRNRPAGFDWMRIVLASSIVVWHSVATSYGMVVQHSFWTDPVWHPPLAALLGMFFALSGFLVAGSLERCRSMISFAGLRVMRIFPALMVETLLSAFILGPLLTTSRLEQYFGGIELREYLFNMVGWVHYRLPGIFEHNPVPGIVNAQLWTVPFELRCYELLIIISVVGMYARKRLLVWLLGALTLTLFVYKTINNEYDTEPLTGNQLVLCFLFGVALFRFRASIPWSGWLGAISALATVVLVSIPGGYGFAPISLAYLTVYLGLLNPPRVPLLFSGDYSYGLFLYGFPIEQAVASAGPWAQHWYVSLTLAFPLTVLTAVCSWWVIEKPILTRKSMLLSLEAKALAAARAGRAWWSRRAAGGSAPFDRSSVGPAENHEA